MTPGPNPAAGSTLVSGTFVGSFGQTMIAARTGIAVANFVLGSNRMPAYVAMRTALEALRRRGILDRRDPRSSECESDAEARALGRLALEVLRRTI